MIRYATLLISAVLMLFALSMMDALIIPLASIVLGFLLLGYAFPELLENLTPYSKTVWLPVGFAVSALIAMFLLFKENTLDVVMGAQWCAVAPCVPIGLVVLSFMVGSFARFGTMKLAGEKLDLFGEKIED
ncbi:hypothetical protein ACFLQ2_02350 [archaeon]